MNGNGKILKLQPLKKIYNFGMRGMFVGYSESYAGDKHQMHDSNKKTLIEAAMCYGLIKRSLVGMVLHISPGIMMWIQ
jgi:hypothetical protein